MQKLLITFRNDEQKIGDRPLLKCFGNRSSFTFLLWQGSAEKSPKMRSTVKDSHWLKVSTFLASHFLVHVLGYYSRLELELCL